MARTSFGFMIGFPDYAWAFLVMPHCSRASSAAISSTRSMMRRRICPLRTLMNAFAKANPSDVVMKSMSGFGEAGALLAVAPGKSGVSSKKNVAGTCRI